MPPLSPGGRVFGNASDRMESITAAAFVIDASGYIAAWTEGAERVLGHAAHDVVGRACHHVLCGRDPAGVLVCHPRCALSPADGERLDGEGLVLYPRSASREMLRASMTVFAFTGVDGSWRWFLHEITSVERVGQPDPGPWTADPFRSARRPREKRSSSRATLPKTPTPSDNGHH